MAFGKPAFERVDRPLVAAEAGHDLALLRHVPAHRLRDDGLFERTRGEQQPAEIVRLLMLARKQIGRVHLREVVADRGRLGHDVIVLAVVVHDRGHLAHWVGLEKTLGFVLPVDEDLFILRVRLVQGPSDDLPAAHGIGVERVLGHGHLLRSKVRNI